MASQLNEQNDELHRGGSSDQVNLELVAPGVSRPFQSVLSQCPDGIIVLDSAHRPIFANDRALELFGLTSTTLHELPASRLLSNATFPVEIDAGIRVIEPRWRLAQDGAREIIIVSVRDVTETEHLLSRLREQSLTDELTGLFNRRGFFVIGNHHLNLARRERRKAYVLVADMDGLKRINDQFGHPAGDVAIVNTGLILKESFRGSDVIARIGGDEFVVLSTTKEGVTNGDLIRRIQDRLEKFNLNTKDSPKLNLSCGMSEFDPDSHDTLKELYREADEAMYEAKLRSHLSRNRCR